MKSLIKNIFAFIFFFLVFTPIFSFWFDETQEYLNNKKVQKSYQEFKTNNVEGILSHEKQNHDYDSWGVWYALNVYREASDLPVLTINRKLCTIASIRLIDQKRNGAIDKHNGFSQVVDKYNSGIRFIGENLADTPEQFTGKEVIMVFATSMGHDLGMRDKDYEYGCVARNGNYTVIIFGSNK